METGVQLMQSSTANAKEQGVADETVGDHSLVWWLVVLPSDKWALQQLGLQQLGELLWHFLTRDEGD